MDSTANIEINAFDYACEESKKAFQTNITSLLEASTLIKSKVDAAITNGKSGIFFSTADAETLHNWIMNSAAEMLAHYNTLDRTNRKAMRLYNASGRIAQHSRCTCKHLIAADRALAEWEQYKSKKVA